MRKLFTILLAASIATAQAQVWSVKVESGTLMRFPSIQQSAMAEIDYEVTSVFSFAVVGELTPSVTDIPTESNVSTILKSSIFPGLSMCAGFGWGHVFTDAVTDHNFHTYSIGLEAILFQVTNNIYCTATPTCQWRTYAEHIGFSSDRCRLAIRLGISYHF